VFPRGFCRAKNCPRDFLLDVLVFSKRTPKAAARKKNFDDSCASVQVRENLLVLVLVLVVVV
jgi:hypothetical protein